MSFNEGSQLDPTRVNDARGAGGGGGRPGLAIGGGVGGIIVLVLSIIFGPQALSGVVNGDPAQSTSEIQNTAGAEINSCTTGASANEREDCRILGTVQSLDSYWKDQGADSVRVQFQAPGVKIFSSGTNTACGSATSAVGPFYCPGDSTIYIDPSFFAELTRNYGADDGALAQEYVVAHEYGHHMQNLTGAIENSQRGSGSQGGSVRVELQADCYAGVWANHASSTTDASGNRLIKQLTEQDVDSALSAAAAVGDDHIQQKTTGRVSPESWSHGSSEQRKAWFMAGYESGDPGVCDTFQTDNLNTP
ncbi:KPN_02809 family neutral zinc metallopeptidase [Galactobacter caseinivorans]|uniref:Neutral zinc metallopeptidase n=1 Tax=Galactobacter caseinivorans TaxID=2676123 RepID=A0A496PKY6_9MICC|nr:neutral zinc metallopeptidase [Galactobacter caseinivorans]RKW71077.1 hypothetical protein DWQ67_04590 [Galactobacter caseinivorans]